MLLSIMVAMDKNRVIGINNTLPWHLPADLQHFKKTTMGKPIVMGRKTYESIGKPLPGRRNIILTRQSDYQAAGCDIFTDIENLLDNLANESEVMIIGGAEIFKRVLPITQRLYLTLIDHEFAGDTFFPQWHANEWREVASEKHHPDANNPYPYRFVTLDKI